MDKGIGGRTSFFPSLSSGGLLGFLLPTFIPRRCLWVDTCRPHKAVSPREDRAVFHSSFCAEKTACSRPFHLHTHDPWQHDFAAPPNETGWLFLQPWRALAPGIFANGTRAEAWSVLVH